MTCYVVPTTAFLIHKGIQKKYPSLRTPQQNNLSLLLLGGTAFGLVDHAWNGELLASEKLALDLLLGVAITAAIFFVWGVLTLRERWASGHAADE